MSKLESIVPPLELCKQIPAGEFEESVLVWRERIGNIYRNDRVKIREPQDISYKVEYAEVNYFPAPTLAEIMAELPEGVQMRMRTARNRERHFQIYHYSYETWTNLPAAAALRMWLRIRREAGR